VRTRHCKRVLPSALAIVLLLIPLLSIASTQTTSAAPILLSPSNGGNWRFQLSGGSQDFAWTTPSSVQSSCGYNSTWYDTNAIDNNTSTYWRHAEVGYHWIVFDMGTSRQITQIQLYYSGTNPYYCWGGDNGITVYVSDNYSNWVDNVWEGTLPLAVGWQQSGIFSKNGRYIKLVDKYNVVYQYMYEFQAYAEVIVKPTKPTLHLPSDGTKTNDNTPYFEWTKGDNATSHRLLVDDDPDFTSPKENRLFTTENSYTIANENSFLDDNYSWKVVAINEDEENTSDVWTFLVDTVAPTSSVDAISPYWCTTSPMTIIATAGDAASGLARVALWYRFSTDNSTWGSWTWFGSDNSSPWSWSFNFLSGNGYYELYSMARDNTGNEETAPTVKDAMCGFDNVMPAPPTLVWPANGENTNDNTPTLDWSPVGENSTPVLYYAAVSDNSAFSYENRNSGWITTDNWEVSPALPDGIWYWRVRARDNVGNVGNNSATRSFRVDVIPPGKPTLVSPDNNKLDNTLSQTFKWTQPPENSLSLTYHIQIDNEASFTSPYVRENQAVTDNTYSYTLLKDGTYYWRVRAKDNAGNWGGWADNFKLTIIVLLGQPAVEVSISPSYENARPGESIIFTVRVTNTGSILDNYNLTVGDNAGWSPRLADNIFRNVAPGGYQTTTLRVTIPEGTTQCTRDRITVTAHSQENMNIMAENSCIAHAIENVVRSVEVSISLEDKTGLPGETLVFIVAVTNTGEVTDAYDLTVSDDAVWGAWLDENVLSILASENTTVTVSVTVPSDASDGDSTMITVTATSRGDVTKSDSDTCTATATTAPPPPPSHDLLPIVVGGVAAAGGGVGAVIAILLKKGIIHLYL